ncbi:hypothetical protein DF17_27950 [Streptomyces rimosus]|nr:hypothetical protein DF17_27950 [Streptomyces rimosus]
MGRAGQAGAHRSGPARAARLDAALPHRLDRDRRARAAVPRPVDGGVAGACRRSGGRAAPARPARVRPRPPGPRAQARPRLHTLLQRQREVPLRSRARSRCTREGDIGT